VVLYDGDGGITIKAVLLSRPGTQKNLEKVYSIINIAASGAAAIIVPSGGAAATTTSSGSKARLRHVVYKQP
jgi:hypothetical protein